MVLKNDWGAVVDNSGWSWGYALFVASSFLQKKILPSNSFLSSNHGGAGGQSWKINIIECRDSWLIRLPYYMSTSLESQISQINLSNIYYMEKKLVCMVVLLANEASDLHPVTCLEVVSQMVQWIHTWDTTYATTNEEEKLQRSFQRRLDQTEWLYTCLEVIKFLCMKLKGGYHFMVCFMTVHNCK